LIPFGKHYTGLGNFYNIFVELFGKHYTGLGNYYNFVGLLRTLYKYWESILDF
jgi:hypothetical protein